MLKHLLLLFYMGISGMGTAQLAIIRDPDGYTNIRKGAGTHTEVLDTVSANRLVYVFGDEATGNWLPVDYNKGQNTYSGYIHRSRIVFLTSFTSFKKTVVRDTLLELRSGSMVISMSQKAFISKEHRVTYERTGDETSYVKLINGKKPWGTDGNLPKTLYNRIRYQSGNMVFPFPKNTFMDLFEPVFELTTAYFDKATGTLYLEAANSDGAGSYQVAWIIQKGQVIHRDIFIPF